FAGQDVYVAIRHTSLNRFIMVLDDLKFSSVKRRDLAIQSVDTMALMVPGDTLLIQGSVVNRGLDTLVFDSAELTMAYRVDNGPYFRDLVDTAFFLLPNEVFDFTHVRPFVAPGFGLFYIEVTFNEIGGDESPANDTLIVRIPVGTVLNISSEEGPRWTLTPNPTPDVLRVQWEGSSLQELTIHLTNLQGQRLAVPLIQQDTHQLSYDLASLSPGIYFLVASNSKGVLFSEKIIKQ
ncbi:MAG: T9SS type A sorting domain-containing protein, partial [Bacteroidota bacterium]